MAAEMDLLSRKTSTTKATTSLAELEETMARISAYKGVKGVMILHRSTGNIIQSTWSHSSSSIRTIRTAINKNLSERDVNDSAPQHQQQHAALLQQCTATATALASSLDDELSFVRIRAKQHEILIAPDKEYVLVVLQNPIVE